jgi:NADH-quinone oxidoreductase subunit C
MRGQAVVRLPREGLAEALTSLRDAGDTRFEQLMDLTAVDYLGRTPRFEVVYQLHSLTHRHRLRVKVGVEEADPVFRRPRPCAKRALGRARVFDLMGIRFAAIRISGASSCTPASEGIRVRKDYPLMQRQPIVPERDPIAQDPGFRRTERRDERARGRHRRGP